MCLLTKYFRSSTLTGAADPAKSQCEESDAYPNLFMALFQGWSLVSSIRAQSYYGNFKWYHIILVIGTSAR